MKEKKRYLLLEGKNLKENVEKSIKEFIGIWGLSKASPMWIKENILCINRGLLEHIKASFVMHSEKIEVLRVSGTLKGLKKKGGVIHKNNFL